MENVLPIRGVHLDLKAHTLRPEAMEDIVRRLAGQGYNTVLLEYQDKFPFVGHLAPIASPDAMTREQIAHFDALCHNLGMQIIPLIQCLGHMYYVLQHEEFAPIGETTSTLCPSDDRSFPLFREMADQMLALHPDCAYVHIGGDEARLAGHCPRCGDTEKYRLLAAHYEKCCDYILSKGKTPILWCDMLLAHPETLEAVREKAVIMDWDYWTTGKSGELARVWGCDVQHPESWPPLHRELFRSYVFEQEPDGTKPAVTKPFPYLQFFRDHGFRVIAASAARCSGDSGFAGQSMHLHNCRAAVRAAEKAGILGVMVTSWSCRRVPWPLTEPSLIESAALMQNPALTDAEADAIFAKEAFGVEDAALAAIPVLLGDAAKAAAAVCDLSLTGLSFPGEDMGEPDTYALHRAMNKTPWLGNAEIAPAYRTLAEAADEAETLLNRAQPKTDAQRQTVAFWRWSIATARVLADYAPHLAEPSIPETEIRRLTNRFLALQAYGEALLRPMLTDDCLARDLYNRTGVHLEYLQSCGTKKG